MFGSCPITIYCPHPFIGVEMGKKRRKSCRKYQEKAFGGREVRKNQRWEVRSWAGEWGFGGLQEAPAHACLQQLRKTHVPLKGRRDCSAELPPVPLVEHLTCRMGTVHS